MTGRALLAVVGCFLSMLLAYAVLSITHRMVAKLDHERPIAAEQVR